MFRNSSKMMLWLLFTCFVLVFQVVVVAADTRVTGSETPSKVPGPGNFGQADNKEGEYTLTPQNAGGPKVYNCLAHALGFNDRWVQPGNGLGLGWTTWDNILKRYDYAVNMPVSCDAKCLPKIMMIWHVPFGASPNDENWVHAMRQETDSKWSSKNGLGSLWQDIADPDAFLEKQYEPELGKMQVIGCFCKFPKGTDVQTTLEDSTWSILSATRAGQSYIVRIGTAMDLGAGGSSFEGIRTNIGGSFSDLVEGKLDTNGKASVQLKINQGIKFLQSTEGSLFVQSIICPTSGDKWNCQKGGLSQVIYIPDVQITLKGRTLRIFSATRVGQDYIVNLGKAMAVGSGRPSFGGLRVNVWGDDNLGEGTLDKDNKASIQLPKGKEGLLQVIVCPTKKYSDGRVAEWLCGSNGGLSQVIYIK